LRSSRTLCDWDATSLASPSWLGTGDSGAVRRAVADLQSSSGNRAVQRLLSGVPARPDIAQRIASTRGQGQGLDHGTRSRLERSFQTDLSGVRVHTGDEAAALSRDLGAVAFTTDRDVFFGRGMYEPGSDRGFRTLAHEVTHIIQQSQGPVPGHDAGDGLTISEDGDAGEREAEMVAERVAAGRGAAVGTQSGAPSTGLPLQRDCGCGGTCGGCGDAAQEKTEQGEGPQLQRMPDASTPSTLSIQRLSDPLGKDETVDWDTSNGNVALFDQSNNRVPGGGALNFGGSDTANFTVPGRDLGARVNFPVTGAWHPNGSPGPGPGPGPGKACDTCTILKNSALQALRPLVLAIVKELPLGPFHLFLDGPITDVAVAILQKAVGGAINILPPDLIQNCNKLDIDDVIKQVKDIKHAADDQDCKGVAGGDICRVIGGIEKSLRDNCQIPIICLPVINAVGDVKEKAFKVVSDSLRAVLKQLEAERKKCKGGGPPPPGTGGTGTATSTMKTTVFLLGNGLGQAVGPGPVPIVQGKGATEKEPIIFSHDGVSNGAVITQTPEIVADGTDGGKAGHTFTVNITYGAPPSPQPIQCPPGEFFPFKIGKAEFVSEVEGQKQVRDWFFGLDPEIRNAAQRGDATVKVTGRASKTGGAAFNLALAKRRAEHAEGIIQGFAGSDSHMRTFFEGFLTAKEPGEAGHERRAEAAVTGEVPADRVGKMKGDPCTGHNNESSDEGPTGPQTSSVPGLEGPGSDVVPS